MSKDEQKSLQLLHRNRKVQILLTHEFNGEWLKEMSELEKEDLINPQNV